MPDRDPILNDAGEAFLGAGPADGVSTIVRAATPRLHRVSPLSRAVTGDLGARRDNHGMTHFQECRTELDRLTAAGAHAEVDALLATMHTRFHDRPGDHVRTHLAWMRVHFQRGGYLRGLAHAFAGLVVAAPSSLVQRHTGLVAPAFDARRT